MHFKKKSRQTYAIMSIEQQGRTPTPLTQPSNHQVSFLNSSQALVIPFSAVSFEYRLWNNGRGCLIFRSVEAEASFLLLSW